VIWAIAAVNIIYSLVEADPVAGRSRRHITENQSIIGSRLLGLKLSKEHIEEPAYFRLICSARVMRNKASQTLILALISYPPRTIKRMKPSYRQLRRIPHVVKVRSRNQQITVLPRNSSRDPARLPRYLLDMQPTVPEGS